jgi:TRAP-type mannitol/chloroaromatic compound transport system substrate-binding protein
MVEAMSSGRLKINYHGAGEVVPAMEAFNAVRSGTLDAAQNTSWQQGEFPAQEIFFSPGGGLIDRQALLYWAFSEEGTALRQEMYKGQAINFSLGATPPEDTWFKKEINSLNDLKGLKMRTSGSMSQEIFSKMGVSVVNLAGGDVVPSLQRGVIDSAEFCDPSMDWDLGLHEVCAYNYSPALHVAGGVNIFELIINPKKWNALTPDLQAIVKNACWAATIQGEAAQWTAAGVAYQKMVQYGTKFRRFPVEVQTFAKKTAQDYITNKLATDPFYAKVWSSLVNAAKGMAPVNAQGIWDIK